jgi:catechol 2,3-dioxygenase-like lactoylglutathione lyase family enzyme
MANDWELDHLGYVVEDINKAFEYYQTLGLEGCQPPKRLRNGDQVCFFRKADASFAFLQPGDEKSIPKAFLEKSGEGIFYLSFNVNNLDKEKSNLEANGISIIDQQVTIKKAGSGKEPAAKSVIFDTRTYGGTLIELRQSCTATDTKTKLPVKSSENASASWKLHHVGYIVKDVVKTTAFFMYIGFEVQLIRAPKLPVAGFVRNGPLTWMFHGPNDWKQGREYFEKHGEGIEHIAFDVEDLDKEIADMTNKSFILRGKVSSTKDATRVFFDTGNIGGVTLELEQPKMSIW